jgi:hypothetical protein
MAKQALTVKVHIDGVKETLAAFRKLPKDASQELREASLKIAETLVVAAKRNADDAQSRAVATTVKVAKDRVPAVQAGGSKRVTSTRAAAYQLLFGSEFGMDQRSGWYANARYDKSAGLQFRPHNGQQGYWFFPAVEDQRARIAAEWNKAADAIIRKFGEGG